MHAIVKWEKKNLLKRALKITITFCLLSGIIIIVESLYFHHILSKSNTTERADLIVVFAGDPKRIEAGYDLTRRGYAPYLIISPADGKKLKTYGKKYGLPKSVTYIVEDKARTTFENAVHTRQIIFEKEFDSVILVTSFYHMPRSFFLLRTLLVGSNVRIQAYGIAIGNLNKANWLSAASGRRRIYNEMVKLWASNLELLSFKIRGRLPKQNPRRFHLIKFLKPLLLRV